MKLSDYEKKFFHVVRDGNFDTLGYIIDKPGMPYICFAESEGYIKECCRNKDISCVICTEELADSEELQQSGKGIAVCRYPKIALYRMHNYLSDYCEEYNNELGANEIGADSFIHPTAIIADKGVKIGNNVIIEAYAVINEGVTIGNNSIIRTGAIIGGMNQFVNYDEAGIAFRIRQIGRTSIGNNVEISYYTTIARGIFSHQTTWIDDNVSIDIGTVIGHNAKIDSNSLIGANCQVCGNTKLGERVKMAPGAIASNMLTIGKGANISIGAVAVNNITAGSKATGNFAIEHSQYLKWHMKKLRDKA